MSRLTEQTSVLLNSIESWNVKFPFDYVWRRKYNVPFMSEVHRNMDFFDMKFDVEEEKMYTRLFKEYQKNKEKEKYKDDLDETDQVLLKPQRIQKMSKEEELDAFENLNLDSFNT